MRRPPVIPPEKKTGIVLSILAGEMSLAEATRREKVCEQSIGRWKAEFLGGGKAALVAGKSGSSSREEQLEAEVAELTQALGEAAVEVRVCKKSAEGWFGPSRTSRFGSLIGVPERTWWRWQAKARGHAPLKGPWPQPVRQKAKPAIFKHAPAHTARGTVQSEC